MSRVTEIRYVGYGVENFDAEAAFYAEVWGLDPVQKGDGESGGEAWFKAPGHDEHHVVALRKATTWCSSCPGALNQASPPDSPSPFCTGSRPHTSA